ncbi:hypothetical protein GSH05_09785 [Burkholderia pseudomallei]|uniref:hypothetical protein n=1 Tax=Burkholderia pseudomallei TaxID=28450 RepID=UPI0005384E54|nr:hypothetical protein [Burkholderia pseudomallei]KGV79793.1 hypothetical protein X887_5725 [Burkholderia pseudomallei MSHR4375]MBM5651945.1 hypothetical protein [Burkholderia pseudomallei]
MDAFTLQATSDWHQSSTQIIGTVYVRISAEGFWNANPASGPDYGPDGTSQYLTAGRPSYPYHGNDGREGELVAKVGAYGAVFPVGSAFEGRLSSTEPAWLYFVINDDITDAAGSGLTDNRGSVNIKIDSEPV